jgi:hypothetical protein
MSSYITASKEGVDTEITMCSSAIPINRHAITVDNDTRFYEEGSHIRYIG